MTEPDVVLTDYLLAVEAGVFAWLLGQATFDGTGVRRWFVIFFCAVGTASLTGGTVHGFFLDATTLGARILWPASLIAVGAAAWAAWAIGAHIGWSTAKAGWIVRPATVGFGVYTTAIVLGVREFSAAILFYLPAVAFVLGVFALEYVPSRDWRFMLGGAAMLLTVLAAGVQWAKVELSFCYLSHNALYHLIQAVGLLLLFASARGIIRRKSC
jgi:hypothetical protein